jgi:hypothetical protein
MMNPKLEVASASIADWNAKIWKLREDIGKAETVHAESQHRRQQHVLEAALGDDAAKKYLQQVLDDDRKAEVNRLARARVDAASDIDKALADFSEAWSRFEVLGRQLYAAARGSRLTFESGRGFPGT